jgi:hypothetical protein
MKHPFLEELILYTVKASLGSVRCKEIAHHLEQCAACTTRYTNIKKRKDDILNQNQAECQVFLEKIQDYIEGKLKNGETERIKQHIVICKRCRSAFEWLSEMPSWDKIDTAAYTVPQHSRRKIESAVMNALSREATPKRKRSKSIPDLYLIFQPLRPDFAFRGDPDDELQVIEHPGGDLCLRTGLKNRIVQLTSIFEEFILKEKTDKSGIVTFKDLEEGDYVVNVKGYELIDIKEKK